MPGYLDTYKMDLPSSMTNSTIRYPINNHLKTKHLRNSYKCVLASILALAEPGTYEEVVQFEAWSVLDVIFVIMEI